MTGFRYSADVLARFPGVVGGVILARGLANGPTTPAMLEAYQQEQRATMSRIGMTPLSEIESLAAWRRVFRGFGVDPTQVRSAAEALLRRLMKKGDIPSINTLVDIGNLVSIRYALPVAAFDTRALRGPVTVRLADGSERYTPLSEEMVEHPAPGEAIFADPTGLVIARRWCWRQSDESAARADTAEALITVEAHHAGARLAAEAATNDLLELLARYAGGTYFACILDAAEPELAARD